MSNARIIPSPNTLNVNSNSQIGVTNSSSVTLPKRQNKTGKKSIMPHTRNLYQDPNTGQFYVLPNENESPSKISYTLRGYFEKNHLAATVLTKNNIIFIHLHNVTDDSAIRKLFTNVAMQSLIIDAEKSKPSKAFPEINEKTINRQLFYDASKLQYYLLPNENESLNKVAKSLKYYLKKTNINASASENVNFGAVLIHLNKPTLPIELVNLFINQPIHKLLNEKEREHIQPQNRKLYYDSHIKQLYIAPMKNEQLHSVANMIRRYLNKYQFIAKISENHQNNVVYIDLAPNVTFAYLESFFVDKIISQSIDPVRLNCVAINITANTSITTSTATSNKRKFSLISSSLFSNPNIALDLTPDNTESFYKDSMPQQLPSVDPTVADPTTLNNPNTIFSPSNNNHSTSTNSYLFTQDDFDEFNKIQQEFSKDLENYKDHDFYYSTPFLT